VAKAVLRTARRMKSQQEAFEARRKRGEEGGTGDGSLASRRGRCGCIYTSRTSMLRQNELEQKDEKRGASKEIKRGRGKPATCRAAEGMSVELKKRG
jgi:hypothetical protein